MPTVLVVDDEPAILQIARLALRREFEVLTALNGEEGLALLSARPVDLIVSDERMPGLSGVEMLLRARDSHPDTPMILMTGYTDQEALARAQREAGVFAVLLKPWAPSELCALVRSAMLTPNG